MLELSDYDALRAQQAEARADGRYLGIGFSHYTEQTAHATQEFIKRGVPIVFGFDSATVRMDPSGKVMVDVSTHNHGQGHETTYAQVVADQLDAVPDGGVQGGPSVPILLGHPILDHIDQADLVG